jgi:hypothetical protein
MWRCPNVSASTDMPATAPMYTAGHVPATASMSTASHVPAASPMSTASHLSAAAPMSTASHVAAASPMSTTVVVVGEGRNNREPANTDSHSQSHPIPRAKPLERQQSLHKEPFHACCRESQSRSRLSGAHPALHKETVRKKYASFQYKESKNSLEKG